MFQDGYVQSFLTHTILKMGVHLCVNQVKPAMKVELIESSELTGTNPTFLPLLVKSYDFKELSKQKAAKQIASNTARQSESKYGIMEGKLLKICKKGNEVTNKFAKQAIELYFVDNVMHHAH